MRVWYSLSMQKSTFFTGIHLVFALLALVLFFAIANSVIHNGALTGFDIRIHNLVAVSRTPFWNNFFLFITYIGEWQVVVLGIIIVSFLLFAEQKYNYLAILLTSTIGGEILVWLIKHSVRRGRPPLLDMLISENDYSFPSGHAFVAFSFYVLLFYLWYRGTQKKTIKAGCIIASILVVSLIGFSRVYLGAHWPSDVFASWTLGFGWILIIITIAKANWRQTPLPFKKEKKLIQKCGVLLLTFWILFLCYFFSTHPYNISHAMAESFTILSKKDIPGDLFATLPRASETITGKPMEPISIVIIATPKILNQTFKQAGWSLIDNITIQTTERFTKAFILDKPYAQIPGAPAFWNTKPDDFAYGKFTLPPSLSQRHHIHFWKTPLILSDQRNIWFATAHFDKGFRFISGIGLPTHIIDPAIDKERDYVTRNLFATKNVQSLQEYQNVLATKGENQVGDTFFTDGKADIIFLK